ncbi:MAG: site-specific integrase [Deltaproteobacteria bacterium]|nr:site-specific integrase [Deltaproteobacteria bacterium]
MALLWECPKCRKRNSEKAKACTGKKDGALCGFQGSRFAGRVWWIEYYDHDKRLRRERIGPNKTAAEQRLREILKARTEGRYIKKCPDTRTLFKDLATWYLELSEVKAKRSYKRDCELVAKLLPHFGDRLLKDINPALVESYKQKRLAEPSGRTPDKLTAPATVNREVACLKAIFNKAIANDKAERSPFQGKKVKMLKENNERDRLLSPEEYVRLLAHCSPQIRPITKVAYHTGMRQGEILFLTWDQVDLKEGFIHLRPEDTKTEAARDIPLSPELIEMFQSMPRGLPGVRVFPYKGKAFGSTFQRAFETARKKAGIEDFTFHDFRHTAINNWRLAGHDYFRIMAASGHKTMHVFKRYNTVSKEELKSLVGENR